MEAQIPLWFILSSLARNISVKFIGVQAVEKTNVENIVAGLKNAVFENLKLDWPDVLKQMVAISCDGAGVMVGCRAGVAVLLREHQECLLTIHFMAIISSEGFVQKKLQLHEKTFSVIAMGLYYYIYHNSSIDRVMLHRNYQALRKKDDDSLLLLPVIASGTRWDWPSA